MHDVFISYAREDRKRIKRLVDALVEQRGWSIWFDESLRPGDEFPRVIQKTLEQVRCVLVVWSKHAVASRWVIAEATEGWERGVLVPLSVDDSEPPLPFRQTEATDFNDWNGSGAAPQVLKLIEAIDRALQSGPSAGEPELVAREHRRRARLHRKRIRQAIIGVAAVAPVVVAWFGWQELTNRGAAEQIAVHAAQLQAEVLELNEEERTRTWASVLLESEERLTKLEVATLLAAEAVRRARTARTREVLDGLLAISPWSDQLLELDHEAYALQFSTDGRLLVAGGGNGDTLVWTLSSNAVTRIPHGGTGDIRTWEDRRGRAAWRGGSTIAIEDSGARVATAGPDETAAVWDARSGRELLRLPHEAIVTGLAFVPGTDTLATVSENGIVRVWDLGSSRELRRMDHGGSSYWIGASNSGRYLVSTTGRTARVWEAGTGTELARLEHAGAVAAARFSNDERQIATFGSDIETTIWSLPDGTPRKRIPVNAGERAGALFGPDGRTIVIGSTDGELRWWALDEDEQRFSVPIGQYVTELASSADHETFVAAGGSIASTWDFASGHQLRQMPYPMFFRAVAISSDGRLMGSSGSDDGGHFILEVTEVRSDDPLETACRKVKRNLTRNEWRTYLGAAEPYRATCPQIATPDADKDG